MAKKITEKTMPEDKNTADLIKSLGGAQRIYKYLLSKNKNITVESIYKWKKIVFTSLIIVGLMISFTWEQSVSSIYRWSHIKTEFIPPKPFAINGKTKQIIEINENFSKEMILQKVKDNKKIKKNLLGKNIIREIYVPGKIVNLVI